MENDLPVLDHLSEIKITYNGHRGGYDVHIEGYDRKFDHKEWEGHAMYLQSVEDVFKTLRLKACGPI